MLSLNASAVTSMNSFLKHYFPPEPSKQPRAAPRLCPLINFLTHSAIDSFCFAEPVPQPLIIISVFVCVSLPCLGTPGHENVAIVSSALACGDPLGTLRQ